MIIYMFYSIALAIFTWNLAASCWFTGSSHSVTPRTSRGGVGRSNAFNLEICGGRCGGCSSCSHTLDRPCHSNAPSNTASGALLGWCMDGQAHRSVRNLVVQRQINHVSCRVFHTFRA